MQTEIKTNFEKLLDDEGFSNSQKEIKEKNFNKFLKQGFPNKRIEDWKFSDLNQIISTNFENLAFSKKDNQSNFFFTHYIKKLYTIRILFVYFHKYNYKLVYLLFLESKIYIII